MTRQQLDHLHGAAKALEDKARYAAKLRDNPGHRRGNARRTDLRSGLSIIESVLQEVARSLRDMADQDDGA